MFNPRTKNQEPGTFDSRSAFTLIEILIVVAIIGVLSSVVLVGLRPAQQNGRDTRRITDLKQVQAGLELYYQKCGFYPGSANCADDGPTGWNGMRDAILGSNIERNLPDDPNRSKDYLYAQLDEGSGYVLGAELENPDNQALNTDLDGDVGGIDCGSGVGEKIYCVQF